MNAREELSEYLDTEYKSGKLVWSREIAAQRMRGFESMLAFQKSKEALYFYTWRETNLWWAPHRQFVREWTPSGEGVLDYGAATGWISLYVDGRSWDYADHETKCMEYLRERLMRRGKVDTTFVLGSDMPIRQTVVSVATVPTIPEDHQWRFVQDLAQVGSLVVLDLDRSLANWPLHFPIKPGLEQLIQDTYDVVARRVVNHYVTLLAFRVGVEAAPPMKKRAAKKRDRKIPVKPNVEG